MPLMTWSSKFSVGVIALDSQHTLLFGILNELHDAMMKGQAQSVASPLLTNLLSGASNHFSTEERLMESTKYPGLAEQRAEHQKLISSVEDYIARFKEGDNTMYRGLLFFMRDWLIDHMVHIDQKYTVWMHEHGVR